MQLSLIYAFALIWTACRSNFLVQHCTNEELPGSGQASVPIDNEGSESEEIGFPRGTCF